MSKEEKFIGVFFNGVMAYLDHIPNMDTEVGTPYLIQNFTAPRVFLSHILTLMGGIKLSKENILDLSGEIANTISGNARSEFGEDFLISVPVVVEGELSNIHLPKDTRSFAIPISWRNYTTLLVVSIED